jgi:hypothetical protein
LVIEDINSVFEGEWVSVDHVPPVFPYDTFAQILGVVFLAAQIVMLVKTWRRGWRVWPFVLVAAQYPALSIIGFCFGWLLGSLGLWPLPDWIFYGFCTLINSACYTAVLVILNWMCKHPRLVRVYEIPEDRIEVIEDVSGYLEEVEEEEGCE